MKENLLERMERLHTTQNGTEYGWGAVLDCIGVPWQDIPGEEA